MVATKVEEVGNKDQSEVTGRLSREALMRAMTEEGADNRGHLVGTLPAASSGSRV